MFVDTTTLSTSFRCPEEVCDFVRGKLGIAISSSKQTSGVVEVLSDVIRMDKIYKDDNIVKLFWDTSYKYKCFSNNWGKSKGIDSYADVCVILTDKASDALAKGELNKLTDITKSKLYVACTRAKRNLYIAPNKIFKEFYTKSIKP